MRRDAPSETKYVLVFGIIAGDMLESLQDLCELGQRQLIETDYLAAQSTLEQAEEIALAQNDFDTLSRLYMPLQESRRQIRQRCGEGIVCLDIVVESIDAEKLLSDFPHGQLLVAGWGSIAPAMEVRALAAERKLFVETFLAAAYTIGGGCAIVIVPTAEVSLPAISPRDSIDELIRDLPPHALLFNLEQLPRGPRAGNPQTFAQVQSIWEQLHAPFLAAADATRDPIRKIEAYRQTIRVDRACELAHQNLSKTAHDIARSTRSAGAV